MTQGGHGRSGNVHGRSNEVEVHAKNPGHGNRRSTGHSGHNQQGSMVRIGHIQQGSMVQNGHVQSSSENRHSLKSGNQPIYQDIEPTEGTGGAGTGVVEVIRLAANLDGLASYGNFKLDAYCEVSLGKQVLRSKVHYDGGKQLKWNTPMQLKVMNQSYFLVQIFDFNNNSESIFIGEAFVFLQDVYSKHNLSKDYPVYDVNHGQIGQLNLMMKFTPGCLGDSNLYEDLKNVSIIHKSPTRITANTKQSILNESYEKTAGKLNLNKSVNESIFLYSNVGRLPTVDMRSTADKNRLNLSKSNVSFSQGNRVRILCGDLTVRPICAKLVKDTTHHKQMNVFCEIEIGPNKKRTKFSNTTGINPDWSDKLHFSIKGEHELTLKLLDQDFKGCDQLVGQKTTDLQQMIEDPDTDIWLNVSDAAGNYSGKINLRVSFEVKNIMYGHLAEDSKGQSFKNQSGSPGKYRGQVVQLNNSSYPIKGESSVLNDSIDRSPGKTNYKVTEKTH
jgi:hypothetical protein